MKCEDRILHKNTSLAIWEWNKDNILDFKIPNFIAFLRSNRAMHIVTLIFLFVTYGIRMTFYSTTLDQDGMMANPPSTSYQSWFSLGRFGLIYLRQAFRMAELNPFFELAFTVFFIFAACISWEYVFYAIGGKSDRFRPIRWIFPIIFLTSPLLAMQFNFLNQNFFVSLCFILMAFSLLFLYKWIFQHTWLDLAISLFLAVICFSTYQAFIPFYISAAAASFLLIYRRYCFLPKNKVSSHFSSIVICLKILLTFIIALILYLVIGRLIAVHHGGITSYIYGQVMWGNAPVSQCIHSILSSGKRILAGQGPFYNLAFPITVGALIIVLLVKIRHLYKGYLFFLIAAAIFVLSPFFMTFLMGTEPNMRTQFSLPFVVAFGLEFLISLIPVAYGKIRALAALFCVLVAFDQAEITDRLFYTQYVTYQQDAAYCTQIAHSIAELGIGEFPSLPVVLVGSRYAHLNKDTIRGDEVGLSTFETESISPSGTLLFMRTLGLNYVVPTSEQFKKGAQISTDMPIWPAQNSIQVRDNMIIVKLS